MGYAIELTAMKGFEVPSAREGLKIGAETEEESSEFLLCAEDFVNAILLAVRADVEDFFKELEAGFKIEVEELNGPEIEKFHDLMSSICVSLKLGILSSEISWTHDDNDVFVSVLLGDFERDNLAKLDKVVRIFDVARRLEQSSAELIAGLRESIAKNVRTVQKYERMEGTYGRAHGVLKKSKGGKVEGQMIDDRKNLINHVNHNYVLREIRVLRKRERLLGAFKDFLGSGATDLDELCAQGELFMKFLVSNSWLKNTEFEDLMELHDMSGVFNLAFEVLEVVGVKVEDAGKFSAAIAELNKNKLCLALAVFVLLSVYGAYLIRS